MRTEGLSVNAVAVATRFIVAACLGVESVPWYLGSVITGAPQAGSSTGSTILTVFGESVSMSIAGDLAVAVSSGGGATR